MTEGTIQCEGSADSGFVGRADLTIWENKILSIPRGLEMATPNARRHTISCTILDIEKRLGACDKVVSAPQRLRMLTRSH